MHGHASHKTVRGLIEAYREAETPRRAEDARHAQWWVLRIGDVELHELTTAEIITCLDRLASHGRSPSTVAFYLRFFRRVCSWGTQQRALMNDPCAGMELPKEKTPPLRVLTETEEKALCAALGEPYSLWVRLAVLTGLKQSEQFTLRWRDIDLQHGSLLLPHPTTGALSSLLLEAEAVSVLTELRKLHPPSMWVFPDLKNPFRPVNIHAFYVGRWVDAVRRAGIAWIAWKDLRHTYGVRLAKSGLPAGDVTRLMRQRETRQAYTYRAWQADGTKTPRPHHPRRPVFVELPDDELRALMARDMSAAPLTLREVAQLYAVHQLGQRPSRLDFERCYHQFWQPWAERPLHSLTKKEVLVWLWGLTKTPGRGNKARGLLKSMFNWARRLDLVKSENPVEGLPPFPASARDRFLSIEELERFLSGLSTLPPKPRAFLLLLLLTGCRRGEALKMQWADVDMKSRLWRKPKTKNGFSHLLPLPIQVMEALHELPRLTQWVFTGEDGQHWSEAMAEKTWGITRRRFGLDGVTLHDLRRTAASHLAMSGENLPTIQNVLAHRSLGPTSVYARLNTKAVDRALQAQADRFCSLAGSPEILPSPLEAMTES